MDIIARDVTIKVVDQSNLTADQWDNRMYGTVGWRDHMAKILNLRVKKLAPTSTATEFYMNLARFATEIGFGQIDTVVAVTEYIYNCTLNFERQEQAA